MNTTIATVRYLVLKLTLACVLCLLGAVALTTSPAHATGACASGSTPCIELQSTGSVPPGGPAGTRVDVIGGGFSSVEGKTISLGVVKGDDLSGASPTFCTNAHVNTGASAVVGAGGTPGQFTASFKWPTGTSVGDWSVCAYLAGTAIENTDNWPFKVSSPYPPTVSVSPTTVAPGGSVTVTGNGWLPPENTIVVKIASCEGCASIAHYGNAASNSSGHFSVPIKIPANAKPGRYLVWAYSSAIPVSTSSSGPYLTIVLLSPTPTATAIATATAAATDTPLPQETATPTSAGPANDSHQTGGGASMPLYLGLGGLVALASAAGFFFLRRRRAAVEAAEAPASQDIPPGASDDPTEPPMS